MITLMPIESFHYQLKHDRLAAMERELRGSGLASAELWHALGEACWDEEDLQVFLDRGGDINARNAQREGLLDGAIRRRSTDYFHALLAAGLDPRQVNREGVSPIYACIQSKSVKKARTLIDLGLGPISSFQGKTPLFFALESGAFAIARKLMQQGYDPNELGPHGKTLLHGALNRSRFRSGVDSARVLKELLCNIPLHAVDDKAVSCAHLVEQLRPALKKSVWDGVVKDLLVAAEEGRIHEVDIPEVLPPPLVHDPSKAASTRRQKSGDTTLVRAKTMSGVRSAIARGETVEAIDGLGRTALWRAASKGSNKIGIFLLSKGAKIGSIDSNTGNTELHELCRFAAPDFLDALLEQGADPSARNAVLATPLHVAASHGRAQMGQRLLDAGVEVNAADHRGDTPLHAAMVHFSTNGQEPGYMQVIGLLLDRGADPLLRNAQGLTPLGILERKAPSSRIDMLRAFMARAQSETIARSLDWDTIDPAPASRKTRRI